MRTFWGRDIHSHHRGCWVAHSRNLINISDWMRVHAGCTDKMDELKVNPINFAFPFSILALWRKFRSPDNSVPGFLLPRAWVLAFFFETFMLTFNFLYIENVHIPQCWHWPHTQKYVVENLWPRLGGKNFEKNWVVCVFILLENNVRDLSYNLFVWGELLNNITYIKEIVFFII